MIDTSKFWTFPVPNTASVLAVSTDWKGLVFLNPTAAWIWKNIHRPDLTRQFSAEFDISLEQANADVTSTLASWDTWPPSAPDLPEPPQHSIQPIDRVTTILVNGVPFAIRFLTLRVAEEVIPRIAALQVPDRLVDKTFLCDEDQDGTSVFLNGQLLATEPLTTSARTVLLQAIAKLAAPNRDFTAILHAGAVGNLNSCVILAGVSFAGKSTLCAAMMQAGYLCYAEDSATLTREYQLAGMPFAVSLRPGSWPLFPHLDRPRFIPSNLNGMSPDVPIVGMIFVNYDAQADATTLEPVPTFDALLELDRSGFWMEHTPEAVAGFLDWVAGLPIYRLRYSSLSSAVAELENLLSQSANVGLPRQ